MNQREIKFRVFHPKLGMWPSSKWGYEYGDWIETRKYAIMQFTGLLDRNGKEIYEGDIVCLKHSGNYEVVWQERAAGFRLSRNGRYSGSFVSNSEVEVVGNIYENPELIQDKA